MDQPPPAKPSFVESSAALATHLAEAPIGDKGYARQRLEDQFRRAFLEQRARTELGATIEPAVTANGRTS